MSIFQPSTRLVAAVTTLVVSAATVSVGAMAPQVSSDIDATRANLERWVETRRAISQERRDWTLGREVLNERVALVQQEIDALRRRITDAQTGATEADKIRSELVARNDALKHASSNLQSIVANLEQRTRAMLPRLPEPIRERVKPLSQRLPDHSTETTLSLSERFQNVVGILNEVNKFNREITLASEVRELPGGNSAEVTVMYVGLGQGYYVGASNSIAGTGTATTTGWEWKPANDAAAAIAQAIAILKNEQVAAYVGLPIDIK